MNRKELGLRLKPLRINEERRVVLMARTMIGPAMPVMELTARVHLMTSKRLVLELSEVALRKELQARLTNQSLRI